tara:strand:- start:1657 stop:2952 length:1296 start_codon:yes stop_codon:yes gene_type:complete
MREETPNEASELKRQITHMSNLHAEKKFKELFNSASTLNKEYPNNIEVMNCLSIAHRSLGNLEKAKQIYISMINLDKKPESSHIFTNAGNLFFDTGDIDKSVKFHEIAIDLDKENAMSFRGLGLIAENSGNAEKAIDYYKKGLEIDPSNELINFCLGNVYRVKENFDEAIKYYELSDVKLSKTNQLECIYKNNDKDLFNEKLKKFIDTKAVEPLVATLSSHASIRFDQQDEYNFCPNPFDYLCKANLYNDERFNDKFVSELYEEINNSNISKKKQSLLKNGFQSSGNLFLQDSPNIKIMENIVHDAIDSFKKKFFDRNIGLIKYWPKDFEVIAWLIIIKKEGNLLPHMHKHGWVSGSIYLHIPQRSSKDEGNIKFSLHGGGYPHDNKDYPAKIIDINKGSMVLFPSSLFHATLPFSSDEERVTLAFDLIPK